MASRITLPFWPSSLNNITWSADNIIAVGGGDQIAILTPSKSPGPHDSHWNSTVFKANAFTAAECPHQEPLTFTNFSPGEELSLRHVHALEWSPAGLGRFGYCVLAVLSSNHVLSIWECEGRSEFSGNWKRRVVVNHGLKAHYEGLEKAQDESAQNHRERKQVSQRVRAFAWSPPIFATPGRTQCRAADSYHLMAVSTEAGDILILNIRSPYDILNPEQKTWQVEVVRNFPISEITRDAIAGSSQTPTHIHARYSGLLIADHISWGPWIARQKDVLHGTVVFIANGRLFTAEIDFDLADFVYKITEKISNCQVHLTARSDLQGPLKFIPNSTFLIVSAPDRIFRIDTANHDSTANTTSHHLDDRWDEVSGIAFTGATPEAQIHFTSHLTSASTPTSTLSTPLREDEVCHSPAWQKAIQGSQEGFSNQNHLNAHVQARTWGIANSPSLEYVATAVTLLPSDAVSHVIPSECRTVINISHEVTPDRVATLPTTIFGNDKKQVSSEVVQFTLLRFLERNSEHLNSDDLVQATLSVREAVRGTDDSANPPQLLSGSGTRDAIEYLRLQVYDNTDTEMEKHKALALVVGQHSRSGTQAILQRLVSSAMEISTVTERQSRLSDNIYRNLRTLDSKLNSKPSTDSAADQDIYKETCRVCQQSIPFESIKWARCVGGHQYSRCSLTFVAIQEPGVTKTCGVCASQALNEWKIPELISLPADTNVEMTDLTTAEAGLRPDGDEDVDGEPRASESGWVEVAKNASNEPASSLARVLFAALDSCIHCGGKFVA